MAAEWNESPAFRAFYNLDYDDAIEILERESRAAQGDPGPFNHLAYGILYRALFRADALEGAIALSPTAFLGKPKVPMDAGDRARFNRALETSSELSRARLAKNPNDAEALYTLGVAELHRANLLFLVEKQWRPALKQAGEARRLHAEALSKNPSLVDAQLVPSVHEYVVGSLPFYLKALGFLVGYRGDKSRGIEGIQKVARLGRRTRVEARVLAALVERREERPDSALTIMRELAAEFPGNHLYRMEIVRLLGVLRRFSEGDGELRQLTEKRYRHLQADNLERFRQEWQAKRRG
jgi:tetratricopeptide (TPR) repeat protein